jgi:hypothetical protein
MGVEFFLSGRVITIQKWNNRWFIGACPDYLWIGLLIDRLRLIEVLKPITNAMPGFILDIFNESSYRDNVKAIINGVTKDLRSWVTEGVISREEEITIRTKMIGTSVFNSNGKNSFSFGRCPSSSAEAGYEKYLEVETFCVIY